MRFRSVLRTVVIVLAILLTGCASTSLGKPIHDAREIVGTWRGQAGAQPGAGAPMTLTINSDGTWEAQSGGGPGKGTYQLVNGRAIWTSATSGRTGTWNLRESDGGRILTGTVEGSQAWMELRPVAR